MSCYYIAAIRLEQRTSNAQELQLILTKFGCNIKTRLGLHEVSGEYCANDGIIILQLCGEKAEIDRMMDALNAQQGIRAKLIDLN